MFPPRYFGVRFFAAAYFVGGLIPPTPPWNRILMLLAENRTLRLR